MSKSLHNFRPLRRWVVVYAYKIHKPYGQQILVDFRLFWTRSRATAWAAQYQAVNVVTSKPFNTRHNDLAQVVLGVYILTDHLQTTRG